ncbi:MAG: hypothetical protein EA402_13415 [Planctomycetota bacterium]|nr:MAG: hypothetical protein EA402_13415 [Planctomycetota bacterium]
MSALAAHFHQLLQIRVPQAMAWIDERAAAIISGEARAAATTIALMPRHTGKADLAPSAAECAAAQALVPGLDLRHWTLDQTARVYAVLQLPMATAAELVGALDALYRCADVAEAVALYQALPCLPHAAALIPRAREGLRSNQKPLVAAVAQRSPFPAAHLDEAAWNQMVLKCLFVGLSLDPIQGIDARCNAAQAAQLCDYARERRAARRPVPWELWRVAVPACGHEHLAEVERTLVGVAEDEAPAAPAAALGLAANPLPAAAELLARFPRFAAAIAAGSLNWSSIDTWKDGSP